MSLGVNIFILPHFSYLKQVVAVLKKNASSPSDIPTKVLEAFRYGFATARKKLGDSQVGVGLGGASDSGCRCVIGDLSATRFQLTSIPSFLDRWPT